MSYTKYIDKNFINGNPELSALRDGFGKGLVKAGDENEKVLALCADLTESTRMHFFKEKYPDRFFEMGIAEQNMATVAAGMASEGFVPFISSYAMFSPGRNWDQIRNTICYSSLPVKIAGSHAGVSVGPDGGTHQALEDLSLLLPVPNMEVVVPVDANEARKATVEIAKTASPSYIRLARAKTPAITRKDTQFELGKPYLLWESESPDILIVGAGPILAEALKAALELKDFGIEVSVLNVHTLKPLDSEEILKHAEKVKGVIVMEEHQTVGGLGALVAQLLSTNNPKPMRFVGVPDMFGYSGKPEELYREFGLNCKSTVAFAKELFFESL